MIWENWKTKHFRNGTKNNFTAQDRPVYFCNKTVLPNIISVTDEPFRFSKGSPLCLEGNKCTIFMFFVHWILCDLLVSSDHISIHKKSPPIDSETSRQSLEGLSLELAEPVLFLRTNYYPHYLYWLDLIPGFLAPVEPLDTYRSERHTTIFHSQCKALCASQGAHMSRTFYFTLT